MRKKIKKSDIKLLLNLIWKFRTLAIFILVFFGLKVIGNLTSLPDTLFQSIGNHLGNLVYSFSSYFSFSLGDVFYFIIAILLIKFLVKLIRSFRQKNNAKAKVQIDSFFKIITLVYVFFYLIWGYNYYKQPLQEIYESESPKLSELKNAANYYYKTAKSYREKVKEDKNGVFKHEISDEELRAEIRNSVYKIQQNYPEIHFVHLFSPNLKPSLYSAGISYLGISGYYNPFTAESHFNTKMAETALLFTQLHETAHQFGFAPENEANFIGFLLGKESVHPDLIYISSFRAMRSILNRIFLYDPLFVKDFVENKYSEGMKRDREYEIEISKKYGGPADDVFSLMNEAFLKMNNQEGLESYGRFVDLLIGFHRKYPLE
ncbi:MAG: DUF3810 domain-containing protein [Weeksellaceae bacterium]|jgi:hypothetical protein|nr:DUF3810 domain-containing protein [Weeksellaceae bacterium]MDX9705059.1 DUF3810 domain-containing protein [Weeksellaceae bacterium]